MEGSIQERIDRALATVREAQSLMNPVDLGLIEKLRFSEARRVMACRLAVGTPRFQCPACPAINGAVKAGLERDIKAALEAEFPGWTVEIE